MNRKLKNLIKKNIPARFLELFSSKAVSITKIPKRGSVISDLFILRCENEWETFFECLDFEKILNAEVKESRQKLLFCFYSKNGHYIAKKKVKSPSTIKKTLLVNKIANDLGIYKDGLFAIFHPQKKQWIARYNSFLAERGYIGYANQKRGVIKGFVHGNLDAIARSGKEDKDQLLGNYSFFMKEYRLQHNLESSFSYELFLVNPTTKKLTFNLVEKVDGKEKKTALNIPSGGMCKYTKTGEKKEHATTLVIESKMYLARPLVFKHMPTSFDVFHG
tara:strand:- start:346 stop:1173 length:828 start_codon:yes stop_codon:yes gene_type:complete